MEKCSLLTALAIVLIVVFIGIGAEAAPLAGGSTSCQSYAGSNACRRKEATSTGPTTWTASVKSYMTNPTISIDTIGRSWWTVRETCNSQITHQHRYDGRVRYSTSSFQNWSYQLEHYCSGARYGWSMGNHDFHESGYSHIYPYKSYSRHLG
jgi:hypothetical protein